MQAVLMAQFLPQYPHLIGFWQIFRRKPSRAQALNFTLDGFAFVVEHTPLRLANQAQLMTYFGQAHVSIVFAQLQTVFGTAGEHAIRLVHPFGNQIVYQHAQISLLTVQDQSIALKHVLRRIRAC